MPTILGTTGDDTLVGSAGADVIVGLSGDDRIEDGGGGPDELIGGTGNDTYYVSVRNNTIVEGVDEGIDTVRTAVATYFLNANVERLVYTGAGAFTGYGNALDNLIIGGALGDSLSGGDGFDQLYGGAGDDLLDGGTGAANTLVGGAGNDVYYVGAAGDSVVEAAGEGNDQVRTALSGYTLSANVENLVYTGSGTFSGTGNALDNVIFGGAGNDSVDGGDGRDYLIGGAGDDTLFGGVGVANQLQGGAGNDTYVVSAQGDSIVELAGEGIDRVRTALATYLLAANVENLTYTGSAAFTGLGNALDNVIVGGSSNDVLRGFEGQDYLVGGAGDDVLDGGVGVSNQLQGGLGNDTYSVSAVGDSIIEFAGEGTDTVQTSLLSYGLAASVENLSFLGSGSFSGRGNALNNVIIGGAGDDNLNGAGGLDALYGENGNDILDDGSGGIPTTPPLSVATRLYGGAGDDTYYIYYNSLAIPSLGDGPIQTIVENANEGFDTIRTSLNRLIMPANVEQLIFITYQGVFSSDYSSGIFADGNELDNVIIGGLRQLYYVAPPQFETLPAPGNFLRGNGGNDVLITGDASDSLDGGIGADRMTGGNGHDYYRVDNVGDVVVELAGEGNDTVYLELRTYTMHANIENLRLQLDGGFTVHGNDLGNLIEIEVDVNGAAYFAPGDDMIYGEGGDDVIRSGAGNDQLWGGAGADTFYFKAGEVGVDRIFDFTPGSDRIALQGYATTSGGIRVETGAVATTSLSTFLYNTSTGMLSYDPDGSSAAPSILSVQLEPGLTLSAADFIFF
jgi:Ca2+-binding RTX toxin-like protein